MKRALIAFAAVATLLVTVLLPAQESLPEGVEQILPRGKIAAVFNPEFVPAERADIPDDAWVLGAVIDGEAHAYSLNLLNRHEVVNDEIAGRPIAAVW